MGSDFGQGKSGTMPLVGITEIAQRAGVLKPAVSNWRRRYGSFPAPVAELHTGPVWLWPSVEAWLIRTDRCTDAGWTVGQVSTDRRRFQLRKAEGLELGRRRLE